MSTNSDYSNMWQSCPHIFLQFSQMSSCLNKISHYQMYMCNTYFYQTFFCHMTKIYILSYKQPLLQSFLRYFSTLTPYPCLFLSVTNLFPGFVSVSRLLFHFSYTTLLYCQSDHLCDLLQVPIYQNLSSAICLQTLCHIQKPYQQ